jgi:hypothetical protein
MRLSHLAFVAAFALSSPVAAETTWTQIQPATSPSARCEYGFAYDDTRNAAVLLGGSANLSFAAVNNQTWEWDGTNWALAPAGGPSARCDQAMAFDTVRDVIAIFGGYNGTYLSDTWERSGTTWANQAITGPSARADAFMAFDQNREVMVLFGGQASNFAVLAETWEYNGTWTQPPVSGPPARWIQRMAYDEARGVTVMFGGASPGSIVRGDTWEYDGTWHQIMIPGPPARYANALAYDSDRQRVVLFGGQNGAPFGQGVLGDTWEYDGLAWTQLAPTVSPPARTFVKMVYDPSRQRMVLFGGYNGTQTVADTWELTVDASTSVGDEAGTPPAALRPELSVSPNPVSGAARIDYALPMDGSVELAIYGARGNLVRRLVTSDTAALRGRHSIAWGGEDQSGHRVASGVYHCRLTTPGGADVTQRLVVVR